MFAIGVSDSNLTPDHSLDSLTPAIVHIFSGTGKIFCLLGGLSDDIRYEVGIYLFHLDINSIGKVKQSFDLKMGTFLTPP